AGEVAEDDGVVDVAVLGSVEFSTAGDQPDARVVQVAVDLVGRKVRLGILLGGIHAEDGRRAILAGDLDGVALAERADRVEDGRAGLGVDVAQEYGRAGLPRGRSEVVPAGQLCLLE